MYSALHRNGASAVLDSFVSAEGMPFHAQIDLDLGRVGSHDPHTRSYFSIFQGCNTAKPTRRLSELPDSPLGIAATPERGLCD